MGFGQSVFTTAGLKTGSVSIGFATDGTGTSGLGVLSVGTQVVNLTGNVYRLAVGSLSRSTLQFPAMRENGTAQAQTLSVRNSALNDGFSDDLGAAIASSDPHLALSGSAARLSAGGVVGGTFTLTQNPAGLSAGTWNSTANVAYLSLGKIGTGLADATPLLSSTQLLLTGTVYRLASGSLDKTSINMGTLRAGNGSLGATLQVYNTASGDGYSDLLGTLATASNGFSSTGGSLLLGGGTAGTINIGYHSGPLNAGLLSGSLSIALRSVGQANATYSDAALGTQTVSLNARVYRPAEGQLELNGTLLADGGTLNLAPVRVGTASPLISLDVRNVAVSSDAFSESLTVTTGSTNGSALSTGNASWLAAGGLLSGALQVGLSTGATGSTGVKTGSVTWNFETDGKGTSGLASALLGTKTLHIFGQVYDGKGVWSGGSGAWADWRQWTVSGGRPGMDNAASVAAADTARIDSGTSPIAVSLPGGTLHLSGLTLAGTGGVALSGGGVISLSGTLTATGGTHTLGAEVFLAQPSIFVVDQGAKLSITGLLSGGKLTKQGAGTLQLGAGYSSMENATVSAGRLILGNGTGVPVIGDEQVSIAGGPVRTIYLGLGAEVAFNVNRNLNLSNLEIIGPGAANVSTLNPAFVVNWKNGLSEESVESGGFVNLDTLTNKTTLKVGDATFTGSTTLVVTNAVTVSGSLAVTGTGRVTFSGLIGGTGSLVMENTGVVVLGGSNTYAGGTKVNAGTLIAQNAGALGTGDVLLAPQAKMVLDLVGSGTISNALRGEGSLAKSGSGTVTISNGSSNYTGGTTVTTGTLVIGNSRALGTGLVSVSAAASLMASGSAGSSIVVSNGLSGAGSLRADSFGTVSLTGVNTLSGGVVLSAGTLNVASTAALGVGAVFLSGGVLNLVAPLKIAAPLTLSGQSALVTTAGPSALSGALSGTGTVQLTGTLVGPLNVTSGAVTLSGGSVNSLVKNGTGALLLDGNTQLNGKVVVGAGSLALSNATKTLASVTTLVVGNKGSTGAVLNVGASGATLASGQTLKGIGTVSGVMKLKAGSKLSPGNSVGTQQIEGRLEVGPGVVYEPEFKAVGSTLLSDLYTVIGAGTDMAGNVTAGSMLLTGGFVAPVQEINRSTKAYLDDNSDLVAAIKGTGLSTGRITDFVPHQVSILSSTIGAVISGTFDGVVSSVVLQSRLEYVNGSQVTRAENTSGQATLSNDVRLVIERVPYRKIGAVGNRAEVGQGLDVSLATKDPLLWNVLDILDASQSQEEILRVLDTLNPKVFAEVYSLALSRLQDVQKTVSDRLTLLGSAMTTVGGVGGAEVLSLATGQGTEWTAWTNAYGSWSAREANPTLGEGGSSRSSVGNVTGVERRFGTLTLGWLGALGTSSTQMNNPGSSITSESWHLGLYMSTPVTDRIFADGSFIFGEGENVLKRTQTLPTTDEFGTPSTLSLASRTTMLNQEWLVQLGMGAQMGPAGGRWSIVPTVRIAYAGVRQQKARESGALSMGIESESSRNGTVLSRTGLDIAREGRLGPVPVRATGSAAWVHDFAADPRRLGVRWQGVDAVPWMISSERRSADVLRLGFSLEFGLGDRRTLRLYGEQEYLQNTKVLRGGVNFTISF